MSKAGAQKAKLVFKREGYWSGVFTGMFIGGFVLVVLIFVTIRLQGLKVSLNPEQMARIVQVRVEAEARKGIPKVLEEIKRDLPAEIAENLIELDELTIGIGKSQVKLPDEVIMTIKNEINRIIESAIINTLNNYNTSQYEAELGKNAYTLVESLLKQNVIGKTYLVKPTGWLTIPVKIVGTSRENLQVGI